jgi:hypothetical protein
VACPWPAVRWAAFSHPDNATLLLRCRVPFHCSLPGDVNIRILNINAPALLLPAGCYPPEGEYDEPGAVLAPLGGSLDLQPHHSGGGGGSDSCDGRSGSGSLGARPRSFGKVRLQCLAMNWHCGCRWE